MVGDRGGLAEVCLLGRDGCGCQDHRGTWRRFGFWHVIMPKSKDGKTFHTTHLNSRRACLLASWHHRLWCSDDRLQYNYLSCARNNRPGHPCCERARIHDRTFVTIHPRQRARIHNRTFIIIHPRKETRMHNRASIIIHPPQRTRIYDHTRIIIHPRHEAESIIIPSSSSIPAKKLGSTIIHSSSSFLTKNLGP